MNLTLFEDSEWKEKCLSKLEILFDDRRNASEIDLDELEQMLQYGQTYKVTIQIEKL